MFLSPRASASRTCSDGLCVRTSRASATWSCCFAFGACEWMPVRIGDLLPRTLRGVACDAITSSFDVAVARGRARLLRRFVRSNEPRVRYVELRLRAWRVSGCASASRTYFLGDACEGTASSFDVA